MHLSQICSLGLEDVNNGGPLIEPRYQANILLRIARAECAQEGGFELRIRNEELANEAHVPIFTVSRLMGGVGAKGWLRKSRGSVVVRQPDELLRVET